MDATDLIITFAETPEIDFTQLDESAGLDTLDSSEAAHTPNVSAILDTFFTMHYDVLYTFARKRTGNHEDAADALQSTYLKVSNRLNKIGVIPDNLQSFTFTALLNTIKDTLDSNNARRRRYPSLDQRLSDDPDAQTYGELIPDSHAIDERLMREEEYRLLEKVLEALPAKQRTMLILKDYYGYSAEKVASLLGYSTEGSVAVTATRSRSHAREIGKRLINQGW